MSASVSKDRRPGASAPGVRSFRWTRETRMSSGPRRCVGGCRELRRRPPERPGRCAKGRRSTRRRGAPPTAPLGPRGASAGCGDGPAACRGTRGAAALGPQVTAPPPLDLLHDLRWVATYHDSWLLLGLELAAVLALRSLYAAWIVGQARRQGCGSAWSLVRAAGRALVFYATASVLLWPWVALLFGGAISHLSYLYFAALPPALAVALVLHRGALNRPGAAQPRQPPPGDGADP